MNRAASRLVSNYLSGRYGEGALPGAELGTLAPALGIPGASASNGLSGMDGLRQLNDGMRAVYALSEELTVQSSRLVSSPAPIALVGLGFVMLVGFRRVSRPPSG